MVWKICKVYDFYLGIVQETEIWPHYQIVHAQNRISPEEWDTKNYL